MDVIQTILTFRGDEELERAIATEIGPDDLDFSKLFLDQMSVEYKPGKQINKVEANNHGSDLPIVE